MWSWLTFWRKKEQPLPIAPLTPQAEPEAPVRVGLVERVPPVTAVCSGKKCGKTVEAFRRYADGRVECLSCAMKRAGN